MFEKDGDQMKIWNAPINLEIFHLVENNKKVLDVGCCTGRLAGKLKKEKNCYVVGLEINEGFAKEAQARCDEVYAMDIESSEELPCLSRCFDIIIFGDVLEHLRYPDKTLQKYKHYLSEDGYILMSIPNIANWMVRVSLFFGKFDYTSAGILDKAHLRFFTLKTIKNMVTECGFKVIYCGRHNRVLKFFGRFWKTLFAHQFILKIVKAK